MRIGIFFGGKSREREVSFAGGRTVYDALDKSLFQAVPIFIDGFGRFFKVDWPYLYKGSIRDFYPKNSFIVTQNQAKIKALNAPLPFQLEGGDFLNKFQHYREYFSEEEQPSDYPGQLMSPQELAEEMDFAFLCLHGPFGEDGSIQGLLDYYQIPYSGAGIFASAFGINKARQKRFGHIALYSIQSRQLTYETALQQKLFDAEKGRENLEKWCENLANLFPLVVKPATQGSSLGIAMIDEPNVDVLAGAIRKAFFIEKIAKETWLNFNPEQCISYLKALVDLQDGIALPLTILSDEGAPLQTIFHPLDLLTAIDDYFRKEAHKSLLFKSNAHEPEIVLEPKIEGKEFSCIVIEKPDGSPMALPPTEIRKKQAVFDYRAKYLPGASRKVTPMEVSEKDLTAIRQATTDYYTAYELEVYARIDGFLTSEGKVWLNDPNTTSGMMPSSFFFHQAAEIGLNPSEFITYIIQRSLAARAASPFAKARLLGQSKALEKAVAHQKNKAENLLKVAVIMGGFSAERHISVESGRNVYEKLSSSGKYLPTPVFLTKNEAGEILLYALPISTMLKDNADDIAGKIQQYCANPQKQPGLTKIRKEAGVVQSLFNPELPLFDPEALSFEALQAQFDFAFIALHGRPGEDGTLQKIFRQRGIPYNGSNAETSALTIDKYATNQYLIQEGFLTAKQVLVEEKSWLADKQAAIEHLKNKLGFPMILKPHDEGCSAAVVKVDDEAMLAAYGDHMFRAEVAANNPFVEVEEFPHKNAFLAENFICAEKGERLIEITGGLLTALNEHGQLIYEVFEPSETIADGGILSLEEKFLAGEGQNITPVRYDLNPNRNRAIGERVKKVLLQVAQTLKIEGYCRIDAFVKITEKVEETKVFIIEINSLPGLTPATCIFHQAAIASYTPFAFLDKIINFGLAKKNKK